MLISFSRFRHARLVLLGFLLFATGCGGSKVVVTGKVTWKGEPVTKGVVAFVPEDSDEVGGGTSNIDEDGNYTLTSPTSGKMRVAVVVPVDGPPQIPVFQRGTDKKAPGGPPKDSGAPAGASSGTTPATGVKPRTSLVPFQYN